MNLKKSLLALIVAAGTVATPAFAGLSVNVGFGVPVARPAPIYEPVPAPLYGYLWVPGYWTRHGHRYVWMRGHHVRHANWHGRGHAYGHYR